MFGERKSQQFPQGTGHDKCLNRHGHECAASRAECVCVIVAHSAREEVPALALRYLLDAVCCAHVLWHGGVVAVVAGGEGGWACEGGDGGGGGGGRVDLDRGAE
eukprot:4148126-Pleurochrysis_carterae.AAC.1